MKKQETLLYSAIGLIALLLALVALNYLVSAVPVRADLTDGKLYTLSDGTRRLLSGLQSPVRIKLYTSRGESVPVPLRGFAQRVEDVVDEFKSTAGDKLIIEKLEPRPDSEEEDAAQLDGVEPQQLFTGESFYLGVAVSRLDRKEAIPAINPQREQLLEYDIARAISLVANPTRPRIGVLSSLPVAGMRMNPMTRQPLEPWVLYSELKRIFEVKDVRPDAEAIDDDIKVLLVIHPRDLMPSLEYALDQFVLRGGKLVAFVDSYAFFDQIPTMPGQPPQQGSSSQLPTLFKAWGVGMEATQVLADVVFASGAGQRYSPTVLTLNRTALNRDNVVTSQIDTLLYAFGGAFEVKPAEGLKMVELIKSSTNSMLMPSQDALGAGDVVMSKFAPSGKSYPLALRLEGRFKTAFPDGKPKSPFAQNEAPQDAKKAASKKAADPGKETAKAEPAAAQPLKASDKDNAVVLVADTDMLSDGAAVDIQEIFGRRIVTPSNGNLAFAIGLVEQLASGDELTSLRTRASAFRPLTVVRELEADAQKQYFGKIKALEDEKQKATAKLQELQKTKAPTGAGATQILTPEEQKELDNFRKRVAETNKELKEVRKNLRHDAEALVFWTKLANIALVPLLVALAGLIVALVRRKRARESAVPA
jgi:ABC-type uncharacterized transport system involved in gliding motility auxiliary subunit